MNQFERYAQSERSSHEWQCREEEIDRREEARRARRAAEGKTVAAAPTPAAMAALRVECPQCHAEPGQRCQNYSGSHCAPHGARNKAAKAAAAAGPKLVAPPAAKPAIAAPPVPGKVGKVSSTADEALRAGLLELLSRYTLGTVLDECWVADRILHPRPWGSQ